MLPHRCVAENPSELAAEIRHCSSSLPVKSVKVYIYISRVIDSFNHYQNRQTKNKNTEQKNIKMALDDNLTWYTQSLCPIPHHIHTDSHHGLQQLPQSSIAGSEVRHCLSLRKGQTVLRNGSPHASATGPAELP